MVASPYAKKLAREGKVDISRAQGTGPGGRIVAADVQKLIESGGGEAAPEAAPEAPAEPDAAVRVLHAPFVSVELKGEL